MARSVLLLIATSVLTLSAQVTMAQENAIGGTHESLSTSDTEQKQRSSGYLMLNLSASSFSIHGVNNYPKAEFNYYLKDDPGKSLQYVDSVEVRSKNNMTGFGFGIEIGKVHGLFADISAGLAINNTQTAFASARFGYNLALSNKRLTLQPYLGITGLEIVKNLNSLKPDGKIVAFKTEFSPEKSSRSISVQSTNSFTLLQYGISLRYKVSDKIFISAGAAQSRQIASSEKLHLRSNCSEKYVSGKITNVAPAQFSDRSENKSPVVWNVTASFKLDLKRSTSEKSNGGWFAFPTHFCGCH